MINQAADLIKNGTSSDVNKTLLVAGVILLALAVFQAKKEKEAVQEPAPAVVFPLPGVGSKPFAQEEPVVLTQDPEVEKLAEETNELKRENRALVHSIKGVAFAECRKTAAGKEIARTPAEFMTEVPAKISYQALNEDFKRTKEKHYALLSAIRSEPKCQTADAIQANAVRQKIPTRQISSEPYESTVRGVR